MAIQNANRPAAVASGKLLRLGEQQMVWAIGLATAQAAGHRETHATMYGREPGDLRIMPALAPLGLA